MSGYQGRGLHGETVQRIGALIISGQYRPGSPLLSETLEAEHGVSKTVVREALKVLAAKGLVDSRPKRGTVVRPRQYWELLDADILRWRGEAGPDVAFLRDLTEVRRIIEPEASRLAALRREQDDLDAFEEALSAMRDAGDNPDKIIQADLTFHRILLVAAHNELLTRMEPVIEAGLRVRDHLVHGRGHWPDSVDGHRVIVEAIGRANADAAAAATADLIIRSAADIEEALVMTLGEIGSSADSVIG
jgi:DNA-binding FadR family transcriptional regulator